MLNSNWLDEVAEALTRQRLSPAYIRRFMDEIADHCDALYQENPRMDANLLNARIGSPDQLAALATCQLRRRTFAGRHPWVMFVAAPLPTAAFLLVGLCLCFLLLLSVVPVYATPEDRVPLWAAATLMQALVWAMRYLPFVAGATLFCHMAKRSQTRPRWSLIACLLVALLACLFAVNLTLPTDGPDSGALTMGFAVPPAPAQWLQGLAPFAVWLIYAWQSAYRRYMTAEDASRQ